MSINNRGPWVTTRSGSRFFLADPRPEEFNLEDMAAGIAKDCRFGGQLAPEFDDDIYTVAQHSVYVDMLVAKMGHPEARPWAIMHDAVEGMYGDMTSPQKSITPEYVKREDHAQEVLIKRFGIPYNDSIRDIVALADMQLSVMEAHVLTTGELMWNTAPTLCSLRELDPDFHCWRPKKAMNRFLDAARAQLTCV